MKRSSIGPWQLFWLVAIRVVIGWHFLYEGLAKLVNPDWTSAGFLLDSGGFLASFFKSLAASPSVLQAMDFLNIWGLILIGLSLILGLFSRLGMLAGIVLLALYYLSHPPLPGIRYSMPVEGSYLLVNKNLIEMVTMLALLYFPAQRSIGIDRFIFKRLQHES